MWVKELRLANGADMIIGLAGNKADLGTGSKRQLSVSEVADYADENGLIFMETSAKRGDNVTEIFMSVAKQVAAKQPPGPPKKPHDTIKAVNGKPKESSGGCCGGGKSDAKS